MTPLVSILTPSFNQGDFITDTIESVLRQDYPRIEHIVVDGGSSDQTVGILQRYASQVRYVSEPDNGFADALNRAAGLANGTILGWLNSDDFYIRPDVVRKAVGALNEGADVVYGHAVYIDENRRLLKTSLRPKFSHARLKRFDFISQPATFFRAAIAPSPLVDQRLYGAVDYGLWLDLAHRGARFERIDLFCAAMRYHQAAKSVSNLDVIWRESDYLRSKWHGSSIHPVRDSGLMATMKLRGLLAFRKRSFSSGLGIPALSLPPMLARPLFQFGLLGPAGTSLLFPRLALFGRA